MKLTRTLIPLLLILLITNCSEKKKPTIWDKAANFVKYHSSENYLRNSEGVFVSMEGEHKASDWAEYFFSAYSTRNWMSENDEFAAYSREPVIPSGIYLKKSDVDKELSANQLIVRADDRKNMIIVLGYEYPGKKLVFKEEWEFPEID